MLLKVIVFLHRTDAFLLSYWRLRLYLFFSSCWGILDAPHVGAFHRLALAENSPPLLPSWIRFTSSAKSWHFSFAASKRRTTGEQEPDFNLNFVTARGWPLVMVSHVKPLLQCARDVVDNEFVTLMTLLEIPVSGCTFFKTLNLPLRFFFVIDRGLGYWFLRPFGRCHDDVLLLLCSGNLSCAIN